MEFFRDAYSVRLLGHTGRYLWADEDKKSVAQKKGRDSYGVIWRVELVPERNAIRLKSVYDLYLMASDYAFLLGATGKKVMQSFASKADSSLEWEPVSAGTFVKLMTKGEKFLRANGGMPPYRNSVTHDVPVLASNQHVVLWEVEVVRKREAPSLPPSRLMSPRQSNAIQPKSPPARPPPQPQAEASSDDDIPLPPPVKLNRRTVPVQQPQPETSSDEETLTRPQAIANRPPLRTNPNPRRTEEDDDEYYNPLPLNPASSAASPSRRRASPPSEVLRNTRIGRRRGSPPREANFDPSPPPRPRRETSNRHEGERRRDTSFDESPPPRRPRESSYKYEGERRRETSFDESPPPRRPRESSYKYEGERRRETSFDESPPPRRPKESSDNYESERRRETNFDTSPPPRRRVPLPLRDDYGSSASETATPRERHSRRPASGPARVRDEYESSPSETSSPRRSEDLEDGSARVRTVNREMRRIFYSVAEDDGEVLAHDDETFGTFMFKGQSLEELTRELKRVTGIREEIILCMRNPLSAKLYKMRLALPQNNAPLSVVIVRSNSQFGRTFSTQPTRQR